MTTIAVLRNIQKKEIEVTVDSQATFGNCKMLNNVNKVFENKNLLCCGCGKFNDLSKFFNIIKKTEFNKELTIEDFLQKDEFILNETTESSFYLVDKKTGKIYCIEAGYYFEIPFEDDKIANGSGCEYALAALHLGKTATEAVILASKLDVYTNNKTNTYLIKYK